MNDKIRFDKIIIHDVNHDDLFDPKVDQVTSETGKPLSEEVKTRELQRILKELKVNSWRGILLSTAAVYLRQMKLAREFAPQGRVEDVRESLAKAETLSQQLFIPFDKQSADSLLKRTLIRGIEVKLQCAEEIARTRKNLTEVQAVIEEAELYSRDYHWIESNRQDDGIGPPKPSLLDPKKVSEILRKAKKPSDS